MNLKMVSKSCDFYSCKLVIERVTDFVLRSFAKVFSNLPIIVGIHFIG
jgi:hypothetical protein